MSGTPEGFSRPLGSTEESWMNAFVGGTGRTVQAILLRRLVDRQAVQRAVDSVLASHPRARSLLVNGPRPDALGFDRDAGKGQEEGGRSGKPAFLVPEVPLVKVQLETGWTPRGPLIVPAEDAQEGMHQGSAGGGEGREQGAGRAGEGRELGAPKDGSEGKNGGEGGGSKATGKSEEASPECKEKHHQGNGTAAEEREEGGPAWESCLGSCFEIGRRDGPGPLPVAEGSEGEGSRGCGCERAGKGARLSLCREQWLQIVELNLNDEWEEDMVEALEEGAAAVGEEGEGGGAELPGREQGGRRLQAVSKEPMGLLQILLHRLPPHHSLLILRVHTMACDLISMSVLVREILQALAASLQVQQGPAGMQPLGVPAQTAGAASDQPSASQGNAPKSPEAGEDERGRLRRLNPKCVEDCIPRKWKGKPFWAHGVDVVGYGLGARRHAYPRFRDTLGQRRSEIVRSGLCRADADVLLQACTREKSSLYGMLTAAVLKAMARYKELGNRGEHFGVTTLVNLRPMLPEELDARTIGFHHSAMVHTHQVGESTELWDLARRCEESLAHALAKRKQFTDMGDLVMLMGQAMAHPQLTPSGSLRTSIVSIFQEPLREDMEEFVEKLQMEDYISCSTVHGVGPCVGVFGSLREDGLHLVNVYPAPLFSRQDMCTLVEHKMGFLLGAINRAS